MARTSVKLDKDLVKRAKKCAEVAGYSSAEEFIQHIVEKELAQLEDAESDEEIAAKLQGLGYID
jgi:metal-responsive CopG/Arc/MetJ family transcriptional regulator